MGGLGVSNLIAIRLSGHLNRGINFYKNPKSNGTVFTFSIECIKLPSASAALLNEQAHSKSS